MRQPHLHAEEEEQEGVVETTEGQLEGEGPSGGEEEEEPVTPTWAQRVVRTGHPDAVATREAHWAILVVAPSIRQSQVRGKEEVVGR